MPSPSASFRTHRCPSAGLLPRSPFSPLSAGRPLPGPWTALSSPRARGTEADPYLIENASQIAAFRDAVNAGDDYDGKYVAPGADVDLEGAEWTPIGAGTRKSSGIAEGSTPFAGTFDGAGHTVSGLKITSTQGADYAIGLFGILDGATVKNLTVADAKIAVPQSELAGILCGMLANDSTVSWRKRLRIRFRQGGRGRHRGAHDAIRRHRELREQRLGHRRGRRGQRPAVS